MFCWWGLVVSFLMTTRALLLCSNSSLPRFPDHDKIRLSWTKSKIRRTPNG